MAFINSSKTKIKNLLRTVSFISCVSQLPGREIEAYLSLISQIVFLHLSYLLVTSGLVSRNV